MPKKTKVTFQSIPQFPRAHYECDVPWNHLEEWLRRQVEEGGLDLDPDFQRAHVWTPEQQRGYIEYVLQGGEVGKQLIFNCTNWDKFSEPGVFALVDGKQRLEAVRAFMRDELTVFGGNKCSEMGRFPVFDYTFRMRICKLDTRAKMLRLYLNINAGGTPHSFEEIERVKALLAAEEAKK